MTSVAEYNEVVLDGLVEAAVAWAPFCRRARRALLNPLDAVWRTPLGHAARSGHADMASALLGLGADVNLAESATGYTALHHAAHAPFDLADEVIKCLAAAGGDVNAVAHVTGATPLHEAVRDARIANTLSLLRVGAGPSVAVADTVFGWTPLHWAMSAPDDAYVAIAHALLSERRMTREVLLAQDREGKTALHLALAEGAPGALRLLVTELHRRSLLMDALKVRDKHGHVPDSHRVHELYPDCLDARM